MRYDQIPTYTLTEGRAIHTGYFVQAVGFPLKWTIRSAWDEITTRPSFKLNTAKIIGSLQNA